MYAVLSLTSREKTHFRENEGKHYDSFLDRRKP